MISNKESFLSVAREAHQEMTRLFEEGRTPKPDGSQGYIVKLDLKQRSFKNALVAVTFAGIYFEALTYFVARQISKSKATRVDKAGYHDKLVELGVTDWSLLQAAETFRINRNDLVHEKAIPASVVNWEEVRFAESCADKAIEFVTTVHAVLTDVN